MHLTPGLVWSFVGGAVVILIVLTLIFFPRRGATVLGYMASAYENFQRIRKGKPRHSIEGVHVHKRVNDPPLDLTISQPMEPPIPPPPHVPRHRKSK